MPARRDSLSSRAHHPPFGRAAEDENRIPAKNRTVPPSLPHAHVPSRFASGMPADAPHGARRQGRGDRRVSRNPGGSVMKCHVPSWGRSPPRPFARHCSLLAGLRSRTPRHRSSAPLARIMRAVARARPPARCGGTLPSTLDVMFRHEGAVRCHEMSCFVMRAVSAGLSARSSSRAAARASAAGIGCSHRCLLRGQGRNGCPCFARVSRVRACGAAGAYRGGAVRARDCPRETADAPLAPAHAGGFFGPQPSLSAEKPKGGPPGSRLSLLSFYHTSPQVKPIREQKMKTPEIFHGMPTAGTSGHAPLSPGPTVRALPRAAARDTSSQPAEPGQSEAKDGIAS